MGGKSRRERSATTQSTDFRPGSRASTDSLRPAPPHHPSALQHHHSFHGFTNEEHALAHHLGNPTGMMVDPSLQHFGHPPPDMTMQNAHPAYGPIPAQYELQYPAPIAAPSGAETDDKRKRGPGATATNDKELRELLRKNEQRTLKDVATEVIATERTSKAEKSKQLFAMIW